MTYPTLARADLTTQILMAPSRLLEKAQPAQPMAIQALFQTSADVGQTVSLDWGLVSKPNLRGVCKPKATTEALPNRAKDNLNSLPFNKWPRSLCVQTIPLFMPPCGK